MAEALFCSQQYKLVICDDLDSIAKGIEDAPVRKLHVAQQRVLRTARCARIGCD
jgi:hypothetical protein